MRRIYETPARVLGRANLRDRMKAPDADLEDLSANFRRGSITFEQYSELLAVYYAHRWRRRGCALATVKKFRRAGVLVELQYLEVEKRERLFATAGLDTSTGEDIPAREITEAELGEYFLKPADGPRRGAWRDL